MATENLETLYRRPLPPDTIAFSSPEGRKLFAEALATGGMDGYFPLAEQFHTQSEPAFCGLGSLVVALNALAIDPGRLWKGPWRWFSEDLLDCCVALDEIRRRGLDLDELGCLARCNGADVELHRADREGIASWRSALMTAARGEAVMIASYDRASLAQTGSGHASPIGGYHAARDLVLLLDVARFKYPPHWVSADQLWNAMQPIDPMTMRSRGWLVLRRGERGVALGFRLNCTGERWQDLVHRLISSVTGLGAAAELEALASVLAPFAGNIVVREPTLAQHRGVVSDVRGALHDLALFQHVTEIVGPERAEAVTFLLLALAGLLTIPVSAPLTALLAQASSNEALAAEVDSLRAQLSALGAITRTEPINTTAPCRS